MKNFLDGYIAIVLDNESKDFLLKKFLPKHSKVYAHHATVYYQPTSEIFNLYKKSLGHEIRFEIIGYADDDKGQVVKITHNLEPKNRNPHITISVNNVPAKYSNELLDKANQIEPIELSGKLEFINNN